MQKCITNVQVVKEDRERQLAKNSFTSDVQVLHELDEIAGTTSNDMYSAARIFEFLRTKGWIIEELADVPDTAGVNVPGADAAVTVT